LPTWGCYMKRYFFRLGILTLQKMTQNQTEKLTKKREKLTKPELSLEEFIL